MSGKKSPSEQRSAEKFKSLQYSKGAARCLTVGLRAAAELKLPDAETVKFLRELRDKLYLMIEHKDIDSPVLERAVNETLLKMSKQLAAAVPSEQTETAAE